ncbi:unnamed protein product [Ciceribacter sp. T2.26MG-112.2]|nr:unnamed protein product [Ciceribacter naphthalenivorans]
MCSSCGQIRWPADMSIPLFQHGSHRRVGLSIPFLVGRYGCSPVPSVILA